jgi:hypothetical protein
MGNAVSRRHFVGTTAMMSLWAWIPWSAPHLAAAPTRQVPHRRDLTSYDGWLVTPEDKRALLQYRRPPGPPDLRRTHEEGTPASGSLSPGRAVRIR